MEVGRLITRKPPSLKTLLASNYVCKIWSIGVLWLSTPLLLKLLGAEAYGIVALYNILYNAVTLADLGLSLAANHELALLAADGSAQPMRILVRTLEYVYCGIAALAALLLCLLAPWLAQHWVHQGHVPLSIVTASMRFMSVAVVLQFTGLVHTGAMQGLRQHVALNFLLMLSMALRQGGAIAIMLVLPPSSLLYFQWQVIVNALWLAAMSLTLWYVLPTGTGPARFDKQVLKSVWRYAAGLSGISISGLLLTQMDKLLLVKLLPLDGFAHYSVAGNLATGPIAASTPVSSVVFPYFTHLVAEGREAEIASLYHRASQLVSVLILPAVAVFLVFARQTCELWLGSSDALQVYRIASVLVAGSALMALTVIPHALQLACGNTRIALVTNIAALLVALPSFFPLVNRYGAVGAALVSVMLGVFTIGIQSYWMWMVKMLPARELRSWCLSDIALPAAVAFATAAVFSWMLPVSSRPFNVLFNLGVSWSCATIGTILVAGTVRRSARNLIESFFGGKMPVVRIGLNNPK